jgi:hypothetical protein
MAIVSRSLSRTDVPLIVEKGGLSCWTFMMPPVPSHVASGGIVGKGPGRVL